MPVLWFFVILNYNGFSVKGVNVMATRDNEKKSRIARDFRRVLIVLVMIQKETEATQKRVEELQKLQADLEAERKRLYDPKYIEKLAREDHNYVKKDEVPIFIVKDKQEDKKDAGDGKGNNEQPGKKESAEKKTVN